MTAPVTSRERCSWCLYDFGNSAFSTIIVTVAFSIYFTEVVAPEGGLTLWGRGLAISMVLVALCSPYLGALADYSGRKRPFLLAFTGLCILFTALLYFVKEGEWVKGLLLFIVANFSFNAALPFYDAFLKELAPADRMGRLSGYGWATGYMGGLLSLLLVAPLLKNGFEAGGAAGFRAAFLMTALFFLIFSLPLVLFLKERTPIRPVDLSASYFQTGITRLYKTLREIRPFKELIKYYAAFFLYNEGINTIIAFSSIFALQVLHLSPAELITYFMVTQIAAAVGTWAFAPLTDSLGAKKTISLTLIVWILIVFWAYRVETLAHFYGLGMVAGGILGATQSASRTLLAHLTPAQKGAEFFGFFTLTGKLSASLGPLFYGEIVRLTGSQRLATLSLNIFFISGLLLLQTMNEREGIETAGRWKEEETSTPP